jgi:hypothetical protein
MTIEGFSPVDTGHCMKLTTHDFTVMLGIYGTLYPSCIDLHSECFQAKEQIFHTYVSKVYFIKFETKIFFFSIS